MTLSIEYKLICRPWVLIDKEEVRILNGLRQKVAVPCSHMSHPLQRAKEGEALEHTLASNLFFLGGLGQHRERWRIH
jgi:hypothetical protein